MSDLVCSVVSIVIPSNNSAKCLPFCLESVRRQNFACIEIIVIDNYSCDKTRSIANSLGACVILFHGSAAAARNVGLAHSTGHFVLFLDSDQQLENNVVEDCVLLCSNGTVEAVKIPEVFVGLNFWGKCSALWKNSVVKTGGLKGGIPRFYNKQALQQRLVFNAELRWWEDQELYQRLKSTGLKEVWCRGKVVHFEADSPQNSARKYLSYGNSMIAFKSKQIRAPYATTFRLTLSTLRQVLKESDQSLSVFLGCLFLVTVKSLSATLGFLSRLK